MDQLLAHLAGDYLLQSNWMATEKVKRWLPALAHAGSYTLPFLLLTRDPRRLAVIAGTHAVIDRYRLAKHVTWAKNQVGPAAYRSPHTETGYADELPDYLKFWLMIAADNTIHLVLNRLALQGTASRTS